MKTKLSRMSGEISQQLRVLTAPPEDLSLISSKIEFDFPWLLTNICNSSFKQCDTLFWHPQAPGTHYGPQTHIQSKPPNTPKSLEKFKDTIMTEFTHYHSIELK